MVGFAIRFLPATSEVGGFGGKVGGGGFGGERSDQEFVAVLKGAVELVELGRVASRVASRAALVESEMAPMALAERVVAVSNGEENGFHDYNPMHVDSVSEFCTTGVPSVDPLNWVKSAKAMEGSHLDEVKSFIKTFYETREVSLEGVSLTIAHVAAVARRPEVQVVLDAATAKKRVDESSHWVLNKIMRGSDIYGVTTGFGATSHRRTQQGVELQRELIR